MAKNKNIETEEVVDKKVEAEFPIVGNTGKFNYVEFEGGAVVYNPGGQRITKVITIDQAKDIVRQQNQAASIKIR